MNERWMRNCKICMLSMRFDLLGFRISLQEGERHEQYCHRRRLGNGCTDSQIRQRHRLSEIQFQNLEIAEIDDVIIIKIAIGPFFSFESGSVMAEEDGEVF